ncbi:hypothetical protein [Spirilliplanes yamanashiensis]|uniref:Uncharacterized protein n=1 Tax=Spirilliplanes yamanashiensis TaxID=42233 RepID=A0A8J4DLR6_9ACTN|nr:hypothetical protein [Spirilliplanes yamanashiensis]MDP9819064.1 hypothetical protein [Spirilliplanes yamanashiensis]GIJ05519.1 hypothetical protein Sya03_48710 [Spirilliplanes yamanashiensis]
MPDVKETAEKPSPWFAPPAAPAVSTVDGVADAGTGPDGRRHAILAIVLALAVAAAGGALVRPLQERARPAAAERPGVREAPATGRTISAPLGADRDLGLDLTAATTRTTVRTADLGDRLYEITATGATPTADERSGTVTVGADPAGRPGAGAVEVRLHSAVRWRLRLTAPATDHVLDLRAGGLAGLTVTGESTRITLTLGPPTGTVDLRLTAPAGQVVVAAPAGTPVRARFQAGAGRATLGATDVRDVRPGSTFTPKNWADATDRYYVDATAAVTGFRLTRD